MKRPELLRPRLRSLVSLLESTGRVRTSLFDFHLPDELIAQHAVEPRDSSRMLRVDRATGATSHHQFRDIESFLQPGDCLVVNNTRVVPARLYGTRAQTGGRWEGLFLQEDSGRWQVMARTRGKPAEGEIIQLQHGDQQLDFQLEEKAPEGYWWGRPQHTSASTWQLLDQIGSIPIPPYIRGGHADDTDKQRYQTVYADQEGSVAAPTAGLHFTSDLVDRIKHKGLQWTTVTLHVGLGTFKPVECDDTDDHQMHKEWCEVSVDSAQLINDTKAKGGRVIAVGTTSVRTLESMSTVDGILNAGSISTDLFIVPGYQFRMVDALITNFHLPKSTLLMMISAFVDRETILRVYDEAVREKYRFYSYGDAMFIS